MVEGGGAHWVVHTPSWSLMQKLFDELNRRPEIGLSWESSDLSCCLNTKNWQKRHEKQISSLVEFKPNSISQLSQSKLVASRLLLGHYCAWKRPQHWEVCEMEWISSWKRQFWCCSLLFCFWVFCFYMSVGAVNLVTRLVCAAISFVWHSSGIAEMWATFSH